MSILTPQEWIIVGLSLKVAAWAIVFALPMAVFVGYALARWQFVGHSLLSALCVLPLVLPPVVTGYVLLLAFGRQGFLGQLLEPLGIQFAFHWTGAALAAGIMAFPLMVRPVRQAFEAVDGRLEASARSLGSNGFVTFCAVSLPLALPGVVAALVLGFAKALGEFGATITFVSNIPEVTRTLPLAIYTQAQSPTGEAGLWRLTAISVFIALVAVFAAEVLSRRVLAR